MRPARERAAWVEPETPLRSRAVGAVVDPEDEELRPGHVTNRAELDLSAEDRRDVRLLDEAQDLRAGRAAVLAGLLDGPRVDQRRHVARRAEGSERLVVREAVVRPDEGRPGRHEVQVRSE